MKRLIFYLGQYHHQPVRRESVDLIGADYPFNGHHCRGVCPGMKMRAARIAALTSIVTILAMLCLTPAPVFPANGLNAIGFGSESVGMGGADLAVARDTTAINTNPAGIAQIRGSAIDLYGAVVYPLSVAHRDRLGNDAEVSNRRVFYGGGGYARRIGDRPVVVGIGIFAQGGAGNIYKDLITPFGTRDEYSSLFRIGKVSPAVAWQVRPSLYLGASVQIVYADMRQKVFPDTSFFDAANPAGSFFGTRIEDLSGISPTSAIGV